MLRRIILFSLALTACLVSSPLPSSAQDSVGGGANETQRQLNSLQTKVTALPAPVDNSGFPIPSGAQVPMESIVAKFSQNTDAGDLSLAMTRFQNFWRANYSFSPVTVLFRPGVTYTFLTQLDIFSFMTMVGTGELDIIGAGLSATANAVLFFPNGTGIRTWFVGSYQPNLAYGSLLTIIGLEIRGNNPAGTYNCNSSYTNHGFVPGSQFILRSVIFSNWGCDGIHIDTSLAAGVITQTLKLTHHVASGTNLTFAFGGTTFNVTAAATDSGTLNAIIAAVNAQFPGLNPTNNLNTAYLGGSGWNVLVEDVEPSTTYTLQVDGLSATSVTPAEPCPGACTPSGLSAYVLINAPILSVPNNIGNFNGLVNRLNNQVGGVAQFNGYDQISFSGFGHTVTLDTPGRTSLSNLFLQNNASVPVSAGGFPTISATLPLQVIPYSSTTNSTAYRVHVLSSGRHGVYIRGGDSGQIVWTHLDVQNSNQVQVLDESLIGDFFMAPHINSTTNTNSVPMASGSGPSVVMGAYVEGGNSVPSWWGAGTTVIAGKPSQPAPASTASSLTTATTGVLDSTLAVRGRDPNTGTLGAPSFNYAYLGDPTVTTAVSGYGSINFANPTFGTNDFHVNVGQLFPNWFEHAVGYGNTAIFDMESSTLNTRHGPGQKLLPRGFRYGGASETLIQGVGTLPIRRFASVTQGTGGTTIDCDVHFDSFAGITSVTNGPPLTITSGQWTTQATPLAGERVWIEAAAGNTGPLGTGINGVWQVSAPAAGQINLVDFTGAAQTGAGTYTAGTGTVYIARYWCWTNTTITSPAAIPAGAAGGNWANGDVLINSRATPGSPRTWYVQTTGVGSAAVWTADNQMAWQPSTVVLGNFAAGGSIGTAPNTVDIASAITINQTTAAQTVTIPSPTLTTASRVLTIINIGTTSLTAQAAAGGGASFAIGAGLFGTFYWDGTTWRPRA